MTSIYNIASKLTFITFLLFVSANSAFAAGGSVTFTRPTSVPTLSGTMLILLSLLLFVVALRTTKQKNMNKLFITLLGTGVLVTAGSGVKLVSNANAGNGTTIIFDQVSNSVTYTLAKGTFLSFGNYESGSPDLNFTITSDPGSVCTFYIENPPFSTLFQRRSGSLPANSFMTVQCVNEIGVPK
ncbi:MAG: hypothetical protein ACI88H_001866 [Cocleimonas sp.]|jgi:hypothetical protein